TLNYTTYGSVGIDDNNCWRISGADIVFSGVCLGVSVCGFVGNGVVLWFLGFQMKRNPFTVYILNLAAADFSLSLLFFLLNVAILILTTLCTLTQLGFALATFFSMLQFLCFLFYMSSLGVLTVLSLERCVSVL
ncbi:MRGRD protein, partial [Serilophus lunatus]|nr:MRGRD protein [Serilophus lunatus]